MTLPKTVKVGSYVYRVTRPTKTEMSNDLGECANDELELKIRSRQRKGKVQEVRLHETLHACHYNAGRNDSDTVTLEQAVELLTHSLLQVLQDNPKLVQFLTEKQIVPNEKRSSDAPGVPPPVGQ
jgi:hypothetical protein